MPEQDAKIPQVLLGQVAQSLPIHAVVEKCLGIPPKAQVAEPPFHVWHASPLDNPRAQKNAPILPIRHKSSDQ